MTAETDAEFVERIESRWMIAAPVADITRLFALARRGADAASRIERLEKALREINQLRYTKRHTIHADNAYECAIGLNAAFLAAVDTACTALEDK